MPSGIQRVLSGGPHVRSGESMGRLRLVRTVRATQGSVGADPLGRLVEHRDRMAAMMRARPTMAPVAYRSRYAAQLWALAEQAATPPEPAPAPVRVALLGPTDDPGHGL